MIAEYCRIDEADRLHRNDDRRPPHLAHPPILAASLDLARLLVARHALPAKARVDALHVAIAATNAVKYLLTWNCRHLANATLRGKIADTCREAGYEPPIIATPEELTEVSDDE